MPVGGEVEDLAATGIECKKYDWETGAKNQGPEKQIRLVSEKIQDEQIGRSEGQ